MLTLGFTNTIESSQKCNVDVVPHEGRRVGFQHRVAAACKWKTGLWIVNVGEELQCLGHMVATATMTSTQT